MDGHIEQWNRMKSERKLTHMVNWFLTKISGPSKEFSSPAIGTVYPFIEINKKLTLTSHHL